MQITSNLCNNLTRLKQRYSQSNTDALRNPWVLAWLGLVAVFLSVNGLFVVLAVVSSPGLVVKNYYEQGRAYEQNAVRLLAARNALHWQTKLELPEHISASHPATYRFSTLDSHGNPIAGADVRLTAYRPSDADADFTTPLDALSPGVYQAQIELPLPGVWDLNVRIRRGEDVFQQSYRVTVRTS